MSDKPQIISVRVDEVHVPEDYVRPLDEAAARLLMRQMEVHGLKTPIAVYRTHAKGANSKFTLIYGLRRLWVARELGWETIQAHLHSKDEAPSLAVTDNLTGSSLSVLEEAEHLKRFAEWWIEKNGPPAHGGDRKSRFHTEILIAKRNKGEISSLYSELNEIFGISKATAWRMLLIGGLAEPLRNALRQTHFARDRRQLRALAKYDAEQQVGIATALLERADGDLLAVLRKDDAQTDRQGAGRMETGDWREQQFLEAWHGMPRERRAAALAKIGAVAKPLDPWPMHFPQPEPLPAPGNASPLWNLMRDPYKNLYVPPTYQDIAEAKRQLLLEEIEHHHLDQVKAKEDATRTAFKETMAKGQAAKSRKPKRGRPIDPPEVKRAKAIAKLVIPVLAEQLLKHDEVTAGHWAVKFCKGLTEKEQQWVANHLGNDHPLAGIRVRVEREREREAAPDDGLQI
ncbi:MAG: ParB N-terminal domain-containing protein [Rhizobiaceae bacterium]|nr:ParB N-terminal domain-containing protein [Rhizobiaceae bacterium]MCZ8352968.1 ParB N-terminal domain-containing protein [Rhizobium sp.]